MVETTTDLSQLSCPFLGYLIDMENSLSQDINFSDLNKILDDNGPISIQINLLKNLTNLCNISVKTLYYKLNNVCNGNGDLKESTFRKIMNQFLSNRQYILSRTNTLMVNKFISSIWRRCEKNSMKPIYLTMALSVLCEGSRLDQFIELTELLNPSQSVFPSQYYIPYVLSIYNIIYVIKSESITPPDILVSEWYKNFCEFRSNKINVQDDQIDLFKQYLFPNETIIPIFQQPTLIHNII